MIRRIIDAIRRWRAFRDYEWRRVESPNWRSSRGGRDFW